MKKIYYYFLFLTVGLCISSCLDKYSEELMMNTPVYMDYATFRSSVKSSQTRDLVQPGKICFKDQYLLIVEYREGIHVIDVSNPANPQNKVFIEVPGCVDIAIKDNILYTDSYIDLVAIDMSDINRPKEINRVQNIFPYTVPTAEDETLPYAPVEQEKGLVIAWEAKREKRELEQRYYPVYPKYDYALSESSSSWRLSYTGGGSTVAFGKSGSMARFGLYDRYLYIVDNNMLFIMDVENAGTPIRIGGQSLGGNIETLFVYDDHLFFGTPSGMLVYSLRIPSTPEFKGNFWHVTACDPVVVQDGYAYITLRSGTSCNSTNINRLDIVKCSGDYKTFELANSYNLSEPYGLGIDGNLLFICDGSAGLRVYDATEKYQIHPLKTFASIKTYDVIPVGGYLFMIGNDGFYMYDYSDINNIRQIGHIPVKKQ